jgi:hypothetical protein
MIPYAVKDFRDEAQYPDWERAAFYRWEFLRRNAEYQRYFETHNGPDDAPPELWHVRMRDLSARFGIRTLLDPRDDEPFAGAFYWQRGIRRGVGVILDGDEIAKSTAAAIERAKRDIERGRSHIALDALIDHLEWQQVDHLRGTVLIAVDVTIPLDPQIAEARKLIEKRRADAGQGRAVRRAQTEKWPSYLRILDGRAAGASFIEIAEVLSRDEPAYTYDYATAGDRIKKSYQQAVDLTERFGVRGFGSWGK